MMTTTWFLRGLLLTALFAGMVAPVQAQLAEDLQVELLPISPPVRLNRPLLTLWSLKSLANPILEGRLLLELYGDDQLLANHVVEDVVLTQTGQRLTLVLPPVSSDFPLSEIVVRVRFEGRGQVLTLQPQILRVPSTSKEVLMAMVCEPDASSTRPQRRDQLLNRTKFESFAPEFESEAFQTVLSTLRPADMPQSALACCGFDTAYLLSDSLARLRGPQLDALREWISAGGSLYTDLPLLIEAPQLQFLKAVTAESDEAVTWSTTNRGGLDFKALPGIPLLAARFGLGRVLIRLHDGEPDSDPLQEPEFRRGFAELWRLPSERVEAVLDHGNWDLALRSRNSAPAGGIWSPAGDAARIQADYLLSKRLVEYLAPRDLRVIPFWLVTSLLAGLVVWAGPVEYLLLGRLRLRKWTWLTFPAAILIVTGLTVWIANRSMADSENSFAMRLADYSLQGQPLRVNELNFQIPAASGTLQTEVRDALFSESATSAVSFQTINQMVNINGRMVSRQVQIDPMTGQMIGDPAMFRSNRNLERASRTTFVGRTPRKYQVQREVKQWTPSLSRLFSIPGQAPIANLDWSRLPVEELLTASALQQGTLPSPLVAAIREQFGEEACAAVVLPRGVVVADSRDDPLVVSGLTEEAAIDHLRGGPVRLWRSLSTDLTLASVRLSDNSLVPRFGPRGGGGLDDLTMIEPGDNRCVLLIAIARDRTVEVHRKLYRLPDAGTAVP